MEQGKSVETRQACEFLRWELRETARSREVVIAKACAIGISENALRRAAKKTVYVFHERGLYWWNLLGRGRDDTRIDLSDCPVWHAKNRPSYRLF